jgi:hypothetical protein
MSLTQSQRRRLRLREIANNSLADFRAVAVSRALGIFHRRCSARRLRRQVRIRRRLFNVWVEMIRCRIRDRLVFSYRLSRCAENIRTSYFFHLLKRKTLLERSGRVLSAIVAVNTSQQKFAVWRRKYDDLCCVRRGVQVVLDYFYRVRARELFFRWRLSGCRERLLCFVLEQRTLKRWRQAFLSVRYDRLLRLCMCFSNWCEWQRGRLSTKRLFVSRQQALHRVAGHHIRLSRAQLCASFHKWRLADFEHRFSFVLTSFISQRNARKRALLLGDDDEVLAIDKSFLPFRQTYDRTLTVLGDSLAGSVLLFSSLPRDYSLLDHDEVDEPRCVTIERCLHRRCMVECEKKSDLRVRTEALQRGKVRQREITGDHRTFVEEKLQSDVVPLCEKLLVATSSLRPHSKKFIGMRSDRAMTNSNQDFQVSSKNNQRIQFLRQLM